MWLDRHTIFKSFLCGHRKYLRNETNYVQRKVYPPTNDQSTLLSIAPTTFHITVSIPTFTTHPNWYRTRIVSTKTTFRCCNSSDTSCIEPKTNSARWSSIRPPRPTATKSRFKVRPLRRTMTIRIWITPTSIWINRNGRAMNRLWTVAMLDFTMWNEQRNTTTMTWRPANGKFFF